MSNGGGGFEEGVARGGRGGRGQRAEDSSGDAYHLYHYCKLAFLVGILGFEGLVWMGLFVHADTIGCYFIPSSFRELCI